MAGIGLAEQSRRAWFSQFSCQRGFVEGIAAWIAAVVQQRPERVNVVYADRGRQAGAQDIEAMADQRGHQHGTDAPFGDDGVKEAMHFRRMRGGILDRVGQLPRAQCRCVEVGEQRQPTAEGRFEIVVLRQQEQVVALVIASLEVTGKAFDAATPRMQHVQHDGATVAKVPGAVAAVG